MNEKTRFNTTLNSRNLLALKTHALTNGYKPSELLNEALEQFLQNEMVQIRIWLPISYVNFLNSNHINLEEVLREPLAIQARISYENGKISEEEADILIKQLGFKRGLEEI